MNDDAERDIEDLFKAWKGDQASLSEAVEKYILELNARDRNGGKRIEDTGDSNDKKEG